MEAKDTAMSDEETRLARLLGGQEYMVAVQHNPDIPSLDDCCNKRQNLAQAETSFKAGIREVVEWIRKYSRNWEGLSFNEQLEGRVPTRMRTFELMEQVWQAQLKKWGVKENNDTFGDT